MSQYKSKPIIIEALTFDEFVQYGRNNGANIVNGMPLAFEYNGCPVTHENDECYIIGMFEGSSLFTPEMMIATIGEFKIGNTIVPEVIIYEIGMFNDLYERISI